MWTTENRIRYDRSKLRYPNDLTDEEWAVIGPLIPRAKRGGSTDVSSLAITSAAVTWAAMARRSAQRRAGAGEDVAQRALADRQAKNLGQHEAQPLQPDRLGVVQVDH